MPIYIVVAREHTLPKLHRDFHDIDNRIINGLLAFLFNRFLCGLLFSERFRLLPQTQQFFIPIGHAATSVQSTMMLQAFRLGAAVS